MLKYKRHKLLIALGAVVLVISVIAFFVIRSLIQPATQSGPTSFAECAASGRPVLDSFPEQCRLDNGVTFINTTTGGDIRVPGEVICLPHRDQSGPQTLECAFGIQASDKTNFGLSDLDYKFLMDMETGKQYTVTGRFKANTSDIYNSLGIIEITDVSEPN